MTDPAESLPLKEKHFHSSALLLVRTAASKAKFCLITKLRSTFSYVSSVLFKIYISHKTTIVKRRLISIILYLVVWLSVIEAERAAATPKREVSVATDMIQHKGGAGCFAAMGRLEQFKYILGLPVGCLKFQ